MLPKSSTIAKIPVYPDNLDSDKFGAKSTVNAASRQDGGDSGMVSPHRV